MMVSGTTCPALLGLLAWGLVCAVQDARHCRISNWLTLGLGAAAIGYLGLSGASFTGVPPGAVTLGLLLAVALSLPGYITGKMGAGDVKLLAALALASGPYYVLGTVAGAALVTLLWVLIGPVCWHQLPARVQRNLPRMAPTHRARLPYAPFFFCGLLASVLWLS